MNENADPYIEALLEEASILMESELEDPEVEAHARLVLRDLKARGHTLVFEPEDDCLLCLHMSLMSALGQVEPGFTDFD